MTSLTSAIEHGDFSQPRRIGLFSYGSGCSSEFYRGVATLSGQQKLHAMQLGTHLASRYQLSMSDYDALHEGGQAVRFGTRDVNLDLDLLPQVRSAISATLAAAGSPRIFLTQMEGFYRRYEWLG